MFEKGGKSGSGAGMPQALPKVLLISLRGFWPAGSPPNELFAFSHGCSPLDASGWTKIAPKSFLWRKIMASISDTLNSVNTLLGDVVRFGIGLAGALLVVQIIFPESLDIIGNVTGVVSRFTSGGLTGLITLLLFMTFMRR